MDAYSVSFTSPDHRSTSRIYQDLESCRVQSLFGTGRDKLLLRSLTMDSLLRVSLLLVNRLPNVASGTLRAWAADLSPLMNDIPS